MSLQYILFIISVIIHVLIWSSIILLPIYSKNFAKINMIYIIPAIYIIHCLPFHIINTINTKPYRAIIINVLRTAIMQN